jgi:hypothetical protein
MRKKRLAAVSLSASLILAGSAFSAWARTGSGSFLMQETYGSYSGSISWQPKRTSTNGSLGGMVVSGTLKDTDCGHRVYADARVHGYGWTRMITGGTGCNVSWYDSPTVFYDGAMLETAYGWTRLCVDLTFSDDCTSEYHSRS